MLGEMGQFGALAYVLIVAGARDDEIRLERTLVGLYFHTAVLRGGGFPVGAGVQGEIRVAAGPLPGFRRHAHANVQNLVHEAPTPSIVEIAEVAQKPRGDAPAIDLLAPMCRAAAEHMHFGAMLQRTDRIVPSGRPNPEHRDFLALQSIEIDRVRRLGAQRLGQSGKVIGHPPIAGAVMAGRQDQATGIMGFTAVRSIEGDLQTILGREDASHLGLVANRQIQGLTHPTEILDPKLDWDEDHVFPREVAIGGAVPGLIG